MRNALVLRATVLIGVAFAGVPDWSAASDPAKAPATAPTTAPTTTASPSKFYGTISAVNVQAKTFTIDGQTYAVVAETELTKAADGSVATMADAIVGEAARGTYTTASDGTMKVTKVRFGRKTGGANGGGGKKKKDQPTTKPASE